MPYLVLIVEDSELLRKILVASFESAGFRVAAADNGAEGLRSALSAGPAAIVTDNRMPVMDGLTMMQRVRASARLNGVVAVLFAGTLDEAASRRAEALGFEARLTKDLHTPRDVLAAVKRQLELRRPRQLSTAGATALPRQIFCSLPKSSDTSRPI